MSETSWNKSLIHNIRIGNYLKIQEAINNGANINHTDSERNIPLIIAIQRGELRTIKYLIRKKANIYKVDGNGKTPLWWITYRNHWDAFKFVLCKITNVNTPDESGNTLLFYAIQLGRLNFTDWLIKNCGAKFTKNFPNGESVLSEAVISENLNICKLLIDINADINRVNADGYTPLALAVRNQSTQIARMLIEREADVNKSGVNIRKKPLECAIENNDFNMATLLLEHGALMDLQRFDRKANSNIISELHKIYDEDD